MSEHIICCLKRFSDISVTVFALNVQPDILKDFSLTVKAVTLIFISGRGSAISSAKQGKSGSIYNLVKNE